MIWAIVLNGTTGFIMAVTFAYCIGPIDAAIHPPYFFAFIGTFYNATGSKAGATAMTCIITLLTLCSAISNVATASRQMFAFARDRGLPAADFLSYVRPGWDIPLNSILVSMCITALLSLINLGSTVAFNAIISIGVVSLLSSCKFHFSISSTLQPPSPTSTNQTTTRSRKHNLHPLQAFPQRNLASPPLVRRPLRHGFQPVRLGIRRRRLRIRFLPDRNARDNGDDELGVCRVWRHCRGSCLALCCLCQTYLYSAGVETGEGSLIGNAMCVRDLVPFNVCS
jgi:hypothetical protein